MRFIDRFLVLLLALLVFTSRTVSSISLLDRLAKIIHFSVNHSLVSFHSLKGFVVRVEVEFLGPLAKNFVLVVAFTASIVHVDVCHQSSRFE